MIKQILQGMVVGIANIIPGVSGGTMMVAMGLYDRLIHAITHLKSEFKDSMKLLIPIFAGAGIAIVALSRLFEFLLATYPIPTNFAFCGLIAGSLPFIFKKVKGHKVTVSKIIPFLIFFGVVILMALLGETGGASADVSFGFVNLLKLFGVGIIAAATMVVPGVSGSMMLMLLGYYDTILKVINDFVDALVKFDMGGLMTGVGILAPFGIGVVIGIFLIAKIIEFIFSKAEIHAYYGIIGLILASPIAILLKTDWSGISVLMVGIGVVTFALGWFTASKLGGE
ncbi:MAG: DUF368 domain-containing protein [Blautia sp.]|uniref:DUF368 domain-containing protein n=1 Tax=Blautia sp. TaxID=1955243 RepID=UPI0024294541|nr:DUF368 domain-containing protein [Blautia sp.]MBS6161582.1 DUF368 domain-containing protein [Bacillota bacterium]MEE1445014.1 DUF368 domain-containing protein [Blautia sp.]